nr:hypothetical protein [uncultured Anaerosporobacter sp.]
MNTEVIEKIQIINSEIYRFFESEMMWDTLDEYLSSAELVMLMDKLEERYGFAYEIEEAVASTVQDDNVRRFIWVGTQKIDLSGYKTLRIIADLIVAAFAEEVEIVRQESSYYKELIPDYLDWTGRDEQVNTFVEMLTVVSGDRFCDEVFAEELRKAGFFVGKADYCEYGDTYYVEDRSGNRIWFDDVIAKNNDSPVKHQRPRIEVLQALIDTKFQKTI